MSSIPRPPGPSTQPPTAPLPSIPLSKHRQSSAPSSYNNRSMPTTPAPNRALPAPVSRTPSSSNVSSMTTAASQTPNPPRLTSLEHGLRKTPSYNVFPKPPTGMRPSSQHSVQSVASAARTSARTSGAHERSLQSGLTSRQSTASTVASMKDFGDSASASPLDTPASESGTFDEEPRGRTRSTTKDKGNVIVSVRVRPDHSEKDSSQQNWSIDGSNAMISYSGAAGAEYQYDNVFSTHDKNARVYDSAAKRLVRRVMEGYHGTVFAYGMTGTGKTFSMQGTANSPGVIPLAITDIFSFIRETPQREFLLRVSYLEIYNEKIHDLLAGGAGGPENQREEIKLREDSRRGVYATPLKEEIVQSPTQLLRAIAKGDNARRTGSTQFNARSSRSHAVVQIVVESRERNALPSKEKTKAGAPIPGGVRVSTLSLIDLAGSERAAEDKERQKEGAHINKSLLTLGTVISKLSGKKDKNGQPMDKEGKHLPYRDSKLTRLLQPALSGGSLISILCTVHVGGAANLTPTQAQTNINETLNTLKFAARARNNIVSHARKAEESHSNIGDASSKALLDRYRHEIQDLRRQLEEQNKEGSRKSKEDDEGKEKVVEPKSHDDAEQRHEEQMLEMQLARTALKERINHLNKLILSSKSVGVNAGRTFSSLSMTRTSTLSAGESLYGGGNGGRSLRSSTSTATLEAAGANYEDRRVSSMTSMSAGGHSIGGGDYDESFADNGDGSAPLTMQVRALQADLADKNRYITTLEKRLLQARRNSRSRMSATFVNRIPNSIVENPEAAAEAIHEKDAEIAELRARLDDKDRMITALRSAARKRDVASNSESRPASKAADRSERGSRRGSTDTNASVRPNFDMLNRGSSYNRRSSVGSSVSGMTQGTSRTSGHSYATPTSPVGRLMSLSSTTSERPSRVASPTKRNHGVDEMTRMLDEMIRQKVESGTNGPLQNVHARREAAKAEGGVEPRKDALPQNQHQRNGSGVGENLPQARLPPTPTSATSQSSASSVRERRMSRQGLDNRRLSGWEIDVTRKRQSAKSAAGSSGQPSPAPGTSPSEAQMPGLRSPERIAAAKMNGNAAKQERNSREQAVVDTTDRDRSISRPRTASTDVSVETVVPDEHPSQQAVTA